MLIKSVKSADIDNELNLLARNLLSDVSQQTVDHAEVESLTLELTLDFKDNNNE